MGNRTATWTAGLLAASALAAAAPPARAAASPATPAAVKYAPRSIYSYAALSGLDRSRGLEVTWSPNPDAPVLEANSAGGPPTVTGRTLTGPLWTSFDAYDSGFRGGVTLASCATYSNGTGLVTGAGPGGGPHVRTFHVDGGYVPDGGGFFAYDKTFASGVFVACADLDGDGADEIITGPGAGGGPNVRVFSLSGQLRASFFAEDPAFKGGIRVAAIPASGGRLGQILTAAGQGGGPAVRSFTPGGDQQAAVFCFDPNYNGGVTVAAGDVDGDGVPDVVCGSASGTSNIAFRTASLAPHPALDALFAHPGGQTSNGIRVAVPPPPRADERYQLRGGLLTASGPRSSAGAALESFVGTPPLGSDPNRLIAGGRVAHPDGTVDPLRIANGYSPRLSPDHGRLLRTIQVGERLVNSSANGSLVVVSDVDGAGLRSIGPGGPADWLANGDVVLGDSDGLYAVDTDGQRRRRPSTAGYYTTYAQRGSSPDGSLLAFVAQSKADPAQLRIVVWHTGVDREVPRVVQLTQAYIVGVAIDNQGTTYVCTNQGTLQAITAAGATRTLLTSGCGPNLLLSPDGSQIAAVTRNNVQGYVVIATRTSDGSQTVLGSSPVDPLVPLGWSPASDAVLLQTSSSGEVARYTIAPLVGAARQVGPADGFQGSTAGFADW